MPSFSYHLRSFKLLEAHLAQSLQNPILEFRKPSSEKVMGGQTQGFRLLAELQHESLFRTIPMS